MMKYYIPFLIYLLSFKSYSLAQEYDSFDIELESYQYLGEYHELAWTTHSIPPSQGFKLVGYDYEVAIYIKLPPNVKFDDDSYKILCTQSNSIIKLFSLNRFAGTQGGHEYYSVSDNEYIVIFPLRIKKSDIISVSITNENQKFRNRYPCLSNILKISITTPGTIE